MAGNRSRLLGLAAMVISVTPAVAQPSPPITTEADRDARIDALEATLIKVQAELKTLRSSPATPKAVQQQQNAASENAAEAVPSQPVLGVARPRTFGPGVPTTAAVSSLDSGRPVITTPDGRFSTNLIAVMHFDVGEYLQSAPGSIASDLRRGGAATDTAHARDLASGSVFRRARIGLGGKAFGDFEYVALFDFGGTGVEDNGHVQELWLQYSGLKPLHFRAGAFPPFMGLEDAGSTNGMIFLERPASVDVARNIAGGDYREAGQVTAAGGRYFASAAITGRAVNTGGASVVQPYSNPLGFVGRLAAIPSRTEDTLVHLGVHGSYVAHLADTVGPDAGATVPRSTIDLRERPELRVDGTRLIDTGSIAASHVYTVGAEVAAQRKSLLIQAEYDRIGIIRAQSPLSDPVFHGLYVEGSWMITGQMRRYNTGNFAFDGPQVGNFDPRAGQFGAWELAFRYSDTNLNYLAGSAGSAPPPNAIRGGEQQILTAGINWYLNSIMHVMLDYQYVQVERLSPNAATFMTPVGAEIGQTYSTGSARFVLAF